MTISVVCWKWGSLFGPEFVNRLRSMLERHLHVPHRLYCVTDDDAGIDYRVRVVPMPQEGSRLPRCRRRMWQWSRDRCDLFGPRMLAIDLDVVLVDDITPIVNRPEPIVAWRVGYASVYSGSFLLADTGALHGAFEAFTADPRGYPPTKERNASDQAMLNHWLSTQPKIAQWTERDGFVTYFGNGYQRFEHLGVSLRHPALPRDARIVVFGSADKPVMDAGRLPWIKAHWR